MTPLAVISVMVVGLVHLSNPGRDVHNVQVDDVLAPRRQAEIQSTVDRLARFQPTRVMVEASAAGARTKYALYRAGKLEPSRNEVVQLGFRLAKQMGLPEVDGIDVMTDFPYQAVLDFARSHGQQAILDQANAEMTGFTDRIAQVLHEGTLSDLLLYLNRPAELDRSQDFYRLMLKMGQGAEQPGADLLSAWYRRNFLIQANVAQLAQPNDRIVIFYGFGHAFLLRQFVTEMPGYRLVEPADYLRR